MAGHAGAVAVFLVFVLVSLCEAKRPNIGSFFSYCTVSSDQPRSYILTCPFQCVFSLSPSSLHHYRRPGYKVGLSELPEEASKYDDERRAIL